MRFKCVLNKNNKNTNSDLRTRTQKIYKKKWKPIWIQIPKLQTHFNEALLSEFLLQWSSQDWNPSRTPTTSWYGRPLVSQPPRPDPLCWWPAHWTRLLSYGALMSWSWSEPTSGRERESRGWERREKLYLNNQMQSYSNYEYLHRYYIIFVYE